MSSKKVEIVDAVIDLETTGLFSDKHEILEIAVIPFDKKTFKPIFSSFHQYIYPQKQENIDEKALEKNKINIKDIDPNCTPELVKKTFLSWLGLLDKGPIKLRPLGHNYATFDLGFLKKWLTPEDYNNHFHYRVNDTCAIAQYLKETGVLKNNESSLKALCSYYKLLEPPHNALGDALLTLEIYKNLIKELTPSKCLLRSLNHYLNVIPDAVASLWIKN